MKFLFNEQSVEFIREIHDKNSGKEISQDNSNMDTLSKLEFHLRLLQTEMRMKTLFWSSLLFYLSWHRHAYRWTDLSEVCEWIK